jgi:hypothetical protein
MEGWVPACLSFGPLFLIAAAKSPQAERFLRIVGVIMVSGALITLWFTVQRQRGEISLLETRLHYLEERVECGAEAALTDLKP